MAEDDCTEHDLGHQWCEEDMCVPTKEWYPATTVAESIYLFILVKGCPNIAWDILRLKHLLFITIKI